MKIYEHPEFYLPNVAHLMNDNSWLGSWRGLRYRLVPAVKDEPPTVTAEVWYGPLCYEMSEKVGDPVTFHLDDDGYQQLLDWLDEQHRLMIESGNG